MPSVLFPCLYICICTYLSLYICLYLYAYFGGNSWSLQCLITFMSVCIFLNFAKSSQIVYNMLHICSHIQSLFVYSLNLPNAKANILLKTSPTNLIFFRKLGKFLGRVTNRLALIKCFIVSLTRLLFSHIFKR